MKNGWQKKRLGEICEIELGRTPARANPSFWDEKRETNNVWISIADLLKAQDNVVIDSKEYVSDKGAKVCKLVPKGTLLVSFKLTLGRLAFAGRDLFTNEAIAALTILNERELSKEFLFYFLHFFDWVGAAEDDVKLKGMTLNKAKLKEMEVDFPKTLPEQRQIVGILNEAFEGIATAKANAEKNLQNARGLFESHLHSVFTNRGEGWVEKRLGDIFDIGSSKRILETEWTSAGVPFYGGKEIVKLAKSETVLSNSYISEEKYREYASKYDMPRQDDIMITARGTIGVGYVVQEGDKFYYKDGNIILMRAKMPTNPHFMLYAFRSNAMADQLGDLTGTTVRHLPIEKAKELVLRMPKFATQNTVVEQIRKIEGKTRRLESIYQQKLTALEALKKSLLHQAFTGRL